MNVQTAIRADRAELQRLAREEAYATPLKDFHPGAPRLFQGDTLWPWFERLRKEEPVRYCTNSPIEPYWSVVKYNDIMHVDTSHGIFSSDSTLGGISIRDVPPGYDYPSFIAMDQPKHAHQRKTVSPMFTPNHLDELARLIRQRSASVLDNLPRNETFNFVDRVSIELTTQMLATLFDFPWEEQRKLTRWSDVSTALPKGGIVNSPEERRQEMDECYAYFSKLWNERVNAAPRNDLLSMMAHSDATRHMDPRVGRGDGIGARRTGTRAPWVERAGVDVRERETVVLRLALFVGDFALARLAVRLFDGLARFEALATGLRDGRRALPLTLRRDAAFKLLPLALGP